MVEEVLDAQRPGCPPEYFNVPLPENHEYRNENPGLDEMPFLRSRYDMNSGLSPNNPRQQVKCRPKLEHFIIGVGNMPD